MSKLVLTTFILFVLSVSCVFAGKTSSNSADIKHEPVWVEADGEYFGSEYDPPKEMKEKAINDAKRQAVETAVGTFISSYTVVSNAQLAEDLVRASVRGRIESFELLSIESDRDNLLHWHARIKALVRPVFPEKGDRIQVKLSLSKTRLKEGEEVRISYQANTDCYVYIYSIAADNSVTLLFPNKLYPDNHITAETGYVFPPEECPIKLRAQCLPGYQEPVATEKVKIIATKNKEIILEDFKQGIFKVYSADSTGLLGDLERRLRQLEWADWGEAIELYTIDRTMKGSK